jgi:hypothetical protein
VRSFQAHLTVVRQKLITSSILLNLFLLGLCGYLFTHKPNPRDTHSQNVLPNTPGPTSKAGASANESFHWSQIEAADYPTYIRNLRRIGCPEETIADIITADVASRDAAETSEIPLATLRPQPARSQVGSAAASQGVSRPLRQDLGPRERAFVASLLRLPPTSDVDRAVSPGNASQHFEIAIPRTVPHLLRVQGLETAAPTTADSSTLAAASSKTLSDVENTPVENKISAERDASEFTAEVPEGTAVAIGQKRRGKEGLFTVEEQQYRALYGWTAFYAAKQAQMTQTADSAMQ